MQNYDVIVLGIGGVGSAVLDQLAQRGVRAIGIDRFNPPHDRGSAHGQTRVIRQAYFEHSNYVPLLAESCRLWRELEKRTRRRLYNEVGLIEIGSADGVLIPGVLRAAAEHKLKVESLAVEEIYRRWPGLGTMGDVAGVFEQAAGYLLVEDCVEAHLRMAESAGARLMVDTVVHEWTATDHEVRVRTDRGELVAARLVITAGAWAAQMLADLNIPLNVRRKSLFWFAAGTSDYDMTGGFPVFLFEVPHGSIFAEGGGNAHAMFYGFPKIDDRGVKVAEHSGGRVIDDPLVVDRSIDPSEQQRIAKVLSAWLPNVSDRVTDHAVCLYTMSPDENFIVDRHPAHSNVSFAAGLSGHGFKFAPVLGRALAELALDGETSLPIDFLSLKRLQHT
jgi:monomeric sarcosine oxidase